MSTPPVPPRPQESYQNNSPKPAPPPVPPLPPNFKPDIDPEVTPLSPHFENPLIAPRPHKLQPDLPANMARQLNDNVSPSPHHQQRTYSAAPQQQPSLGFSMPMPNQDTPRGRSSVPPAPNGADWTPWGVGPGGFGSSASPYPPSSYSSQPYSSQPYPSQPYPSQPQPQYRNSQYSIDNSQYPVDPPVESSFAVMSLGSQPYPPRPTSAYPPQPSSSPLMQPRQHHTHARNPSGPKPPSPRQQPSSGPPSLTVPLPTIPALSATLPSLQRPDYDPAQKVVWVRDVLSLVDRAHHLHSSSANAPNVNSTDVPVGPVRIGDPQLQRLVDVAIPLVQELSSPQQIPSPMPLYIAEAIYLRATCEASGAYPQFIQHNPRTAFRDFEQAAKSGFYAAWFKLGRDYENFGDVGHARDCFERGVKYGVESCLYRMGMAHLMGQLGLPANPEMALPLLQRAATLASVEVPQPAYVYGLLLLSEFSHIQLPPYLFDPLVPPGVTPHMEARKHLERAAYLNFAPAQYKLGHSYEYATPPFPFDALLSVQYYSLASQQGEVEADMALSKWFLCGAEGSFEKDEHLAWTFADKAARKGLPSAEFAMGYYAEVGVGGPKDIEAARKWYSRAAEHGNNDAKDRLQALSQPTPQALSRDEHKNLTDTTLVRKRTQAKQRSEAAGGSARAAAVSAAQTTQIVENVRKNSILGRPAPAAAVAGPSGAAYSAPQTSSPPELGGHARLPAVDEARRPGSAGLVDPGSASNSTNPRVRNQGPTYLPAAAVPPAPMAAPSPMSPAVQRSFANAPRYSLADPGSGSAPSTPRSSLPGSPTPSNAFAPRQNRPGGAGRLPEPAGFPGQNGPGRTPKPAGPQSFAEMGIASTKVEDEHCILM